MTTNRSAFATYLLEQAVLAAAEQDKAFMSDQPEKALMAEGRQAAFTEALAHVEGVSVAQAGSEVLASLP